MTFSQNKSWEHRGCSWRAQVPLALSAIFSVVINQCSSLPAGYVLCLPSKMGKTVGKPALLRAPDQPPGNEGLGPGQSFHDIRPRQQPELLEVGGSPPSVSFPPPVTPYLQLVLWACFPTGWDRVERRREDLPRGNPLSSGVNELDLVHMETKSLWFLISIKMLEREVYRYIYIFL